MESGKLTLKNMSRRGDDHPVYSIYQGDEQVGTIQTYIDSLTSTLVVRNFFMEEGGVLSRRLLKRVSRILESKARRLGLDRLGVERKPEHIKMYSSAGFVESEGDWGSIVSKEIR